MKKYESLIFSMALTALLSGVLSGAWLAQNTISNKLSFYLNGRSHNVYKNGVRMYSVSEYLKQASESLKEIDLKLKGYL